MKPVLAGVSRAACLLLLAVAVADALGWAAVEPPAKSANRPAGRSATSKPLKRTQRPKSIERVTKYYLDLYGKYLDTGDPLARTVVVISLARLDDPRSTRKLMQVMLKDKSFIVRVYAWEAIHARLGRLNPEQRADWANVAFDLGKRNYLWGDLRVGLVGAMAVQGPTPRNKELFKALFLHTNSLAPGDMRTLDAMGKLLAQWKSPDLVRGLIEGMRYLETAWRAEYVLGHMKSGVQHSGKEMRKLGSTATWFRTYVRWSEWYRKAGLKQIPVEESTYTGQSALLPAGEKITDSADPKWRKDLELEKFKLKQLDVGFVIDATGSMGPSLKWIRGDVVRMMRAFELVSREPRIGVTLYRDYGDQFLVWPIPLSSRAEMLAAALKGASARGGGDIPEGVYCGLLAIARTYRWSGPRARKVVVLMGDAPPHKRELQKIDDLVGLGAKKGFMFYAVKVRSRYHFKRPNYDPKLTTFDRIAKLGGGKSFWVDFHAMQERRYRRGVAVPRSPKAPERVIFREMLKAAMAKGYEDRVDAFVNVLEQYIERAAPEKRRTIPPYRPPSGPHRPSPPPPDPQAQ